ncbi:molybdenum cofactor sulfurase [Anoxybacter fermentans]|uniref:Molybdenum cofactor sulfurase n=1 Tax=Anoxybacter fermentans TaxID=1323375 RepID=A0A3S9SUL2_9FIRM|nr:MOSC domain-containing protein [Anoxybacter fermentans]AZR72003.1 molybdenum cofactor sulfurase [Anoxybacter fermentans]
MKGKIVAISISSEKGMQKINQSEVMVKENYGIVGDAHAGKWHRQISLLAQESIDKMIAKGLNVKAGDFAENITTQGIDLLALEIGDRLKLGMDVVLEITQKGKECHSRCAIYEQAGDCVMPREGIFARVIKGGKLTPGMEIEVVKCNV